MKRGTRPAAPAQKESPPAFAVSRWFYPDLSLTAALAVVAYCLFIFRAPVRMFADSDAGWHVIAGDQILRTSAVPRTDTFSFLAIGHGWFAWEWLAEVVMALAHRALGLSGLVFLFTLTLGAAFWLCFRLHLRLGGNFFLACLMALPLMVTAQVHWLARPHLFSYLFLLGTIFYFESAGVRFRVRDALLASLGTALWAGIHGSFPMGGILAALYGAGHGARALLCRDVDKAYEWNKARWFALIAICAAAGSLLNPYGLELHRHLLAYSMDTRVTAQVSEWTPVDFSRPATGLIAVATALGILGALLALWQRKVPHFLAASFVIILALRAARGMPLMALVALPMANAAITTALERLRAADWFTGLSVDLRELDRGHHGAALVPLAALGILLWLLQPAVVAHTGFAPDRYPVEADATVASLPPSARIFAKFTVGGYYVYRFGGQRKIWIDGRGDYFGPEPLEQFGQIAKMELGWEEAIERTGFTHAVIEKNWRLVPALRKAGWTTLFSGTRWVVLQHPQWQ